MAGSHPPYAATSGSESLCVIFEVLRNVHGLTSRATYPTLRKGSHAPE